jgi:hypothetical protein
MMDDDDDDDDDDDQDDNDEYNIACDVSISLIKSPLCMVHRPSLCVLIALANLIYEPQLGDREGCNTMHQT